MRRQQEHLRVLPYTHTKPHYCVHNKLLRMGKKIKKIKNCLRLNPTMMTNKECSIFFSMTTNTD